MSIQVVVQGRSENKMKGSTIRQKLSQVGTSQKELARLLDVSPQALASILASTDVRIGTVERICKVLNLPITFFYEEDGEGKPETVVLVGQNNQDSQSNKNMYDTQKIWETNNIEEKVRGLLREQHKRLAGLCSYVGMTDPGIRKVFTRDTCNINTLKKIAEYFSVPVAYFLPENPQAKAETEKDRELEYLRGKVAAYETALRLLAGERVTEPIMAIRK